MQNGNCCCSQRGRERGNAAGGASVTLCCAECCGEAGNAAALGPQAGGERPGGPIWAGCEWAQTQVTPEGCGDEGWSIAEHPHEKKFSFCRG